VIVSNVMFVFMQKRMYVAIVVITFRIENLHPPTNAAQNVKLRTVVVLQRFIFAEIAMTGRAAVVGNRALIGGRQ